jgi:hypothetical protein
MAKFLSFLRKSVISSIVGYAKDFNAMLKSIELPELYASNAYLVYMDTFARLELGHLQERKNPFTEKLAEYVKARGRSFQGVNLVVKSYLNSNVEAERDAAALLNALFVRYASEFSKNSYSGATGMINSFIQDMKQKNYAAAVATLKIEAKIKQVLDEDALCESTHLQAIVKELESEENVTATSIRGEFIKATRNLMILIGTRASEEKGSKWVVLNGQIAIHNAKFEKSEAVRQAALKKKREEKKKEEEKKKDEEKNGQKPKA